jgi:hypothetical protein
MDRADAGEAMVAAGMKPVVTLSNGEENQRSRPGERRKPAMTEKRQKTAVHSEYLGDISTELLLQNLTNINRHHSSIDAIRLTMAFQPSVKAISEFSP